jgi:PAS domain S-box-containing protein
MSEPAARMTHHDRFQRPPHIVVVDDDEVALGVLARLLRDDGFTVTTAQDGVTALAEARRSLPDVVLADLQMDPINGVDLCKLVHELDEDLPVVVMTAHSDMASVIECMHAGAEDYLIKPLEYEAVVLCVERTIARRKEKIERRELQRAHAEAEARHAAQLKALLENLNEGVIIVDATGRVTLMNDAGRVINGLGKDETPTLDALNALEAFDLDDRPLAPEQRPIMRALRGEQFSDYEIVGQRPSGERCRIASTGTSVCDQRGQVVLAIVVFRDITELRLLEKQREEYLGLISHDLRTPLSNTLGFVALLKASVAEQKGALFDLAERAQRNVKRMTAMLEDLTEATSLEARGVKLSLQPCELHALIRDLIDGLDDAAASRITIETDGSDSFSVRGDSPRLERVIANLLTNALKYSANDASVKVRLAVRGATIELDVIDHGIGIAAEHQHNLFDRFYRTTAGRARTGGLGLGLYIARLIVEAHGGRIVVSSQVGTGSTFRVTLPAA